VHQVGRNRRNRKKAEGKKTVAPVLKLDDQNEEKEIEFELDYLLSLTLQERFQLMFKKTKELIELLERNGHRRPDQIIKRA
jgi:hypothetical protein